MIKSWPCALVLLSGCGRPTTDGPRAAPSASVAVDASVLARPDAVMTLLGPGELEVAGSANLATELRVEAREGGGPWQTVEQADPFRLRASCEEEPGVCMQLQSAQPLRVARWSGLFTNSQCGLGMRGTSNHGAATIRFVAHTCDDRSQIESPAFEVPALVRAATPERAWAADSITAATAVRLEDSIPGWNGAAAKDPEHVAGFKVRAGAEVVLDPAAQTVLSAVLRDPAGYDDQVAKRCKMSHLVGFRVTRTLPTTGAAPRSQQLELGIDFVCNKLFVVRGEAAPRTVHASHFDPSRAAWLSLVQRLMPTDHELTAVK